MEECGGRKVKQNVEFIAKKLPDECTPNSHSHENDPFLRGSKQVNLISQLLIEKLPFEDSRAERTQILKKCHEFANVLR